MLHDQFAEYLTATNMHHTDPEFAPPYQFMADGVAASPRFVLDRSATMMVQALTIIKPSSLLKALPLCRLPAPSIWVEFAWADRQDWQREASKRGLFEPLDIPDIMAPTRLGFLIREVEYASERVIEFNVAWNFPGEQEWVQVCFKNMMIATQIDSKAVSPDTIAETLGFLRTRKPEQWSQEMRRHIRDPKEVEAAAELEARLHAQRAPYWSQIWNRVTAAGRVEMTKRADFDLLSEWKFVIAILALLNSRNMMKVETVEDYERLNKSRIRSGKKPLMSYRPITINLSKVQKRRMIRHALGERRQPDEPQFVIGHLKVRQTGIFWWNHHERYGEGARPRDYKVTA